MGSRRILLVDDEDDIREVTALSLRMIGGHEVLTAASGEEALARAIEAQPDVILLDVMMPGLGGPTTLSRLQQDPPTFSAGGGKDRAATSDLRTVRRRRGEASLCGLGR